MNTGTPDSRNSRLTSELLILSKFENHVTELKYVRYQNSRLVPELSTVGTPDSRRNSRPSRLLKSSRWLLAIYTGHVRYDQDSEPSKSVKRETSELPTVGTPDEPTREQ